MDVPIPRYGCLGNKPGVVDLGGGGRIPQSPEGRQSSHEELCQENALTN